MATRTSLNTDTCRIPNFSNEEEVRKIHLKILSDLQTEYLFKFKPDGSESEYYRKWKFAIGVYDDSPKRREATVGEDLYYLMSEGIIAIGNYDWLINRLEDVDHRSSKLVRDAAFEILSIQGKTTPHPAPPKVEVSGRRNIEVGNEVFLKGFVLSYPHATYVRWKRKEEEQVIDVDIQKRKFLGSSTDRYNPLLIINDAEVTDSGTYFLLITNDVMSVVSNYVTIEVAHADTSIVNTLTTISVIPTKDEKTDQTNFFLRITCRLINCASDWIDQNTSASVVLALFENVKLCTQNFYEENDRDLIQSLLDNVTKKVQWWAGIDVQNRMTAFFHIIGQMAAITSHFNIKEAKAEVGSIVFHMKFEASRDFDTYQKEYRNGNLHKKFEELLLHVPYLELFGLEKGDVVLKVENVEEASKHKGKEIGYVVAIDFGTSTSGFAYARKSKLDEIEIGTWVLGSETTNRTKNHILLNQDRTFNSFGFEAEDAYAKIADNEDRFKDYLYFEEFTTHLPTEGSLENTHVTDQGGKTVKVLLVLQLALKYIIDQVLECVKQEAPNVKPNKIKCVLVTHLASNSHFISAVKPIFEETGFDSRDISIMSYCDGVASYCQHSSATELHRMKEGMPYMVISLGDAMSTISQHTLQNGDISEVRNVVDMPLGCKQVRNGFSEFLSLLFGVENVNKIRENEQEDYKDLLREFEIQRMTFSLTGDDIELPISPMIPVHIQTENESTIYDLIESSEYKDSVNFSSGNLIISCDVFRSFFEPVVEMIMEKVAPLILESDSSAIVLCGEFSKCPFIQERLKEVAGGKEIIVLTDADVAEMKGALLSSTSSNKSER
ncbi:uncharacterized protein LOC125681903 isoform X2 [Ostrea edulis]|uniref:uncharacterized protein LOC125681903 isoform X2 n=1 Tax=Ostrea edulis TaxID=37623 RepID=UPI002094E890|nr:uncharacterized protein LOC125681903 isoform X2 [Ostrea edulis]